MGSAGYMMESEDRVAGHRTGVSGADAGVSKAENRSLLARNFK